MVLDVREAPFHLETSWPFTYTALSNPWKGTNAMTLIASLLDSAKAKANIESDYRLSKVIGITHNAVSNYRLGKSMPNEKILAQLCALSGDDLAVIAAQVQAARAQSPEGKTMWMMIAARLAGRAQTAFLSVVFAIALIAGFSIPAKACESHGTENAKANSLYIVSSTFLSVVDFLLVRLRRFPGFFALCRLAFL